MASFNYYKNLISCRLNEIKLRLILKLKFAVSSNPRVSTENIILHQSMGNMTDVCFTNENPADRLILIEFGSTLRIT